MLGTSQGPLALCWLILREVVVKGAVIGLLIAFPAFVLAAFLVDGATGFEIWRHRLWFVLGGLAVASFLFIKRRRTLPAASQGSEDAMPARRLSPSVAVLFLLILAFLAWQYLVVDRCLDSGGAWSYGELKCDR